MKTLRGMQAAGLVLTLICSAFSCVQATERADFFDKNRKPSVSFNKGEMTWTLTNGAIQRVIAYNEKAGSLRTTALRDVKRQRELGVGIKSEGAFAFAADLHGPVVPLNGWKMSEASQPDDWAGLTFADTDWKPVTLPLTGATSKTVWLRCAIPPDRMKFDRAYSFVLDRAVDGDAEIYVDGVLAEKIAGSSRPATRFVQVDLVPKNKVIGIKFTGARLGGLTGSIGIAEVGNSPVNIDLGANWKYMMHSVNAGADNSQVLTITLSGIKQYEGLDVDINYQIFPGDEPTLAKWFTFISHRPTPFLIEEIVYDDWKLPGSKPVVQTYSGDVFTAFDSASNAGLMTAMLSPLGGSERSPDGKSVASVLRPYYRIKPDARQLTPQSLTAFYAGSNATGAFAYQLYVGQYVANATASSVPTVYSTKAYGDSLNAALCDKIIPEVAKTGAKVFLLDDGWQTNLTANSGTYGDWVTNKMKFPLGLMPVSSLAREENLRLGLFAAPAAVSETAQATLDHPEWLLRRPDGSRAAFGKDTVGMCFTSGAEESFTKSMQIFCRELSVTYLKLGGPVFYDDCVDPTHEHPLAHALSEQILHWRNFCDTMRTVDRNFTLDAEIEHAAGLTAYQDTENFGAWTMASASFDGYAQADAVRRSLSEVLSVRPPFSLTAEAPCHLPTDDLNALEYALSSAAAGGCNLQLLGQIGPMTAKERDTVHKWVKWNEDNRAWLAYAQPLASLGRPFDPANPNDKPHVDGVMHLRPAHNNRYGYVCLWNPSGQPAAAQVNFNAADYFVKISGPLDVVRMKDGQATRFVVKEGAVHLPEITLAPHSWEILELRGNPAPPPVALNNLQQQRGLSKRPLKD